MHRLKVAAIGVLWILSGCSNDATTERVFLPYQLPPELQDCRFFEVPREYIGEITVVYCPHADVSVRYTAGKTTYNSAVIHGGRNESNNCRE